MFSSVLSEPAWGNGGGTFSMPGTPTLEHPSSPTTPMFPPLNGERADGWGHVFIFECVMEIVEPEPEPEESLSLVQTIMAAFGRRTNSYKRSSSTPAKPDLASSTRATLDGNAKPSPGPSGKEGHIRCLTFHMVIRFPKTSGHPSRPAYSRASSFYGKRSRAGSAADDVGSFAQHARSSHDLHRSETAGNGSSAKRNISIDAVEMRTTKSSSAGTQEHALQVITSPETLLNLTAGTQSPPRSRNASRVRVHSNASLAPRRSSRKSKVVIQVSDERALETIKKALSVGGTQDSSDVDDESVTDGNETDSSKRSVNYRRATLLRSQSHADEARSRPSSRGPESRGRGDSESSSSEMRGRQPRSRVSEDFHPEFAVGSPVKEESPSSFDIEAMITECGNHIDKLLRQNHTLEVNANESGEQALKQMRDLLLTMSRRFSALEHNDTVKLASTLSPWTFNLFSAISPSLGIDVEGLLALNPQSSPAEGSVIRFLAADVLQIAARTLSPREIFVAVQERLELMLAEEVSRTDAEELEEEGNGNLDPSKNTRNAAWVGAFEMAGLLKVLSIGE